MFSHIQNGHFLALIADTGDSKSSDVAEMAHRNQFEGLPKLLVAEPCRVFGK